jgi:predicted deacylase
MSEQQAEAFTFDGSRVDPGETEEFRHPVSEIFFGDPVRLPVAIINCCRPGSIAYLSAAIHGDERNGIEVVREVARE